MGTFLIVLISAIILLGAGAGWLLFLSRRSQRLRTKFGPEYHRTLSEYGDSGKAERELARREERVQHLNIHPLSQAARERYQRTWHEEQARFVDDPQRAVIVADYLVLEVMNDRGYPMADFERRVEDISVDHPHLVQNYLAAREIISRQQRGEATTEDLRHALVHYRAVFDELLETEAVSR